MQPLPVLRSCPSVHCSGWTEGQERDARELLDAVERERADAMMPGPRAEFLAGRLAQRRFAAALVDEPAAALTVDYACPRCGQGAGVSHGRPGYSLRGTALPLVLSLARAPGWILLAAVPDPAPGLRIGVDVEDPDRMGFAGFDAVALTPAEHEALGGMSGPALLRARARFWARKEAWLKMTGEGLRTAPDTLDVRHRAGIRDLTPAETGLPANLAAAVAVTVSG
jgi:4'-phosphopantetheinyl transferase